MFRRGISRYSVQTNPTRYSPFVRGSGVNCMARIIILSQPHRREFEVVGSNQPVKQKALGGMTQSATDFRTVGVSAPNSCELANRKRAGPLIWKEPQKRNMR